MGIGNDVPQETPGVEVDVAMENKSNIKELVKTLARDAEEEVLAANKETMSGVRAPGGDSHKYSRERGRPTRAVVMEV